MGCHFGWVKSISCFAIVLQIKLTWTKIIFIIYNNINVCINILCYMSYMSCKMQSYIDVTLMMDSTVTSNALSMASKVILDLVLLRL